MSKVMEKVEFSKHALMIVAKPEGSYHSLYIEFTDVIWDFLVITTIISLPFYYL